MEDWRCWFEYIRFDSGIPFRSIWNPTWEHHSGAGFEWHTTCVSFTTSVKFNFTIVRSISTRYILATSLILLQDLKSVYLERYSTSIFIWVYLSSESTACGTMVSYSRYKLLRRVTVGCNNVSRTRNFGTSIARCKRSSSECFLST